MRNIFRFLFAAIFLAGCITKPASEVQGAHASLVTFMTLLSEKDYDQAVSFYGGGYEQLQAWNPDLDSLNYTKLWERACEQNGLQCLEIRSTEFLHHEGDTYVFQVEFDNPDGSLFVLGPCCGANETEMPPVSQFEFTVIRNTDGRFVVMNTPPYVP